MTKLIGNQSILPHRDHLIVLFLLYPLIYCHSSDILIALILNA